MIIPRVVAAFTTILLVPAFFTLPSCTHATCADGGDGCPCVDAVACGALPPCTGWICDGTCHTFQLRTGIPCRLEACPGPDDCGGVCDDAARCIECLQDGDCHPGHTCELGNVCSRCDDGVQNGDETGVDCGGSCPLCPGTCKTDADCPGGYCWDGLCVSCSDGIQNGDEFAVDCGSVLGHCPVCLGYPCDTDAQCGSGICSANGVCCKTACEGCYSGTSTGDCKQHIGYAPWAGCLEGQLCGWGGGCTWPDGHSCSKNEECYHISCVDGICKP